MKCGVAYVVAGEVVDVRLGEHGVVLELRLAERWGVASNDDKLGLSGAESLEGRLVSEGDYGMNQQSARGSSSSSPVEVVCVPFPDFITSARRELMPSEVFLVFLTGAISALSGYDDPGCGN